MMVFLEMLIAMITLSLAWQAWRKTMRDKIRDDLFELRDEWREFWEETGLDPASPVYLHMRRQINSYLKYTKSLRLVSLIYIVLKVDKRMIERSLAEIDNKLLISNDDAAKKIRSLNHRMSRAVQTYMLSTTLLIIPLAVVTVSALLGALLGALLECSLKIPAEAVKKAAARLVDGLTPTKSETIQFAVMA